MSDEGPCHSHADHQLLASLAAAGISGTAQALVDTPWWLTAVASGYFALCVTVALIQSVFPQESEHRLDWWRDRRHHQLLRRQSTRRTDRARLTGTAEEAEGDPCSGRHSGGE